MWDYFSTVRESIKKGDFGTVQKTLEDLVADEPKNAEIYYYLGLIYLLQGNLEVYQEPWLSYLLSLESNQAELALNDLITFLEINLVQELDLNRLGNAKLIYEAIVGLNSEYENLILRDKLVDAIVAYASSLHFQKDYQQAADICEEVLTINSEHLVCLMCLGSCYYNLENFTEARLVLEKAIGLDNTSLESYHGLGMTLEQLGELDLAIKVYESAPNLDPDCHHFYVCIGNIYFKKEEFKTAIKYYDIALKKAVNCDKAPIFESLAKVYKSLDDFLLTHFNLGYAHLFKKEYGLAISHFDQILEIGLFDEYAYGAIIDCYTHANRPLIASQLARQGLKYFPNSLSIKHANRVVLPVLYQDVDEIQFYRDRFCHCQQQLISETDLSDPERVNLALDVFTQYSHFYLAYQGKDDLDIQIQYANYAKSIVSKAYPNWSNLSNFSPARIRNFTEKSRKIKIAFVSRRLNTLGMLYLGWVKNFDQDRFDIFIYEVSGVPKSRITQRVDLINEFEASAKKMMFLPNKIEAMALALEEDSPDIIVLPEIIDPEIILLASLRLAPVQCTSWAHPLTTGIATVDYFLSSHLMEPENGNRHYSEKLVRLPNIGFCIPEPVAPNLNKNREDFRIKKDAIVYWCCQSLFKYLPHHDYIFPSIAQHSAQFQFVFLDSYHGLPTRDDFTERLARAFSQFQLNYEDYCLILPRMSESDHVRVHQLADVFLDCLSWSGGITTSEAIFSGLPVVTCPGKFMRGRHSYAMLKMIGVTETIASNAEEYIQIAVKLGLNNQWRQQIRTRMDANRHKLFNDQVCVRALESFFMEALAQVG
jgi:predicted O-linked N-acetylglucosamine transferase (SPINDLY family)